MTIFDNDTYFCFVESDDTVSDLITWFLKSILGHTFFSSTDYNAYIIFQGVKAPPYTVAVKSFKTKKDINIIFVMRQTTTNDTIVP